MTKREKVLLGFCAAAAVGGGLYYATMIGGSKDKPTTPPKDYTALITKVQVDLKKGALTESEKGILAAATDEWTRDPLRGSALKKEEIKPEEDQMILPKYIGFINIGERPIAIIDGDDYRVGETIKGGEFKLIFISKNHVELLLNGANETIEIPLEKENLSGEPN